MCASGKRKEKEGENPRTSAHVAGRTRRSGSPLFSLNGGVRTAGRKTKSADRLWSVSAFAFDEQSITRFVGNVKDPQPLL